MEIQIPKALVDVLEEIDRNARAYGWEVAKRDGYPPNGTPFSPENPFINPDWRDRVLIVEEQVKRPTHPEECSYKYFQPTAYIGSTRALSDDEIASIEGLTSMGIYVGDLSDDQYWTSARIDYTGRQYENVDYTTINVETKTLNDVLKTENVDSCDTCPFGHHLNPPEEWDNDPTEAYFSCSLGLGESPERQWGEHPPCDAQGGFAARILAALNIDKETGNVKNQSNTV